MKKAPTIPARLGSWRVAEREAGMGRRRESGSTQSRPAEPACTPPQPSPVRPPAGAEAATLRPQGPGVVPPDFASDLPCLVFPPIPSTAPPTKAHDPAALCNFPRGPNGVGNSLPHPCYTGQESQLVSGGAPGLASLLGSPLAPAIPGSGHRCDKQATQRQWGRDGRGSLGSSHTVLELRECCHVSCSHQRGAVGGAGLLLGDIMLAQASRGASSQAPAHRVVVRATPFWTVLPADRQLQTTSGLWTTL